MRKETIAVSPDSPVHTHAWEPIGIVEEDEVAYSPVSRYDHQVRTNKFAVRSCTCGALRKTLVSRGKWRWKNR